MLTTLIIDDEPLAHNVLKHHLQGCKDIAVVASCFNATEALSYLARHQVDLLLLDINMPALSGIELLKVLHHRPHVIIISAYKEYALDGFELDVVDYLLKPVSASRLCEAINKVQRRIGEAIPAADSYIALKVDREKRRFLLNEIILLEAYGNYVKVWHGQQITLVSSTLKRLLQQLPRPQFLQIHKSVVVNKNHVIAVDGDQVRLATEKVVKAGKLYKHNLPQLL